MDPDQSETEAAEPTPRRPSLGEEYGLTPEQTVMFDMYL